MLGNAAEWCIDKDGQGVTRGGSWKTRRERLSFALRERPKPAWSEGDPQDPPSRWWYYSAPFVGLRVVRDAE